MGSVELGKNQVLREYILKNKKEDPTTTDIKLVAKANNDTKNAFEAVMFLTGLNSHRYQDLIDELANAYTNG